MAEVGISVLAATQGFTAFTQFLPRLSEVRRANPGTDVDIAADVRIGEIAAAGVTIGTGAVIASLTRSNTPIIIAVVVSLGFIFMYESVLRGVKNPVDVVAAEIAAPTTRTEYPEG